MKTLSKILNSSEVMPFLDFCRIMKITAQDMKRKSAAVEMCFSKDNRLVVRVHHTRTIRWMIARIEKHILYSLIDDMEYAEYSELLRVLSDRLERGSSDICPTPSDRRAGVVW